MTDQIDITWDQAQIAAAAVADRHRLGDFDSIHGIPQGGAPVALMVSHHLNLPVVSDIGPRTLVVDDLVDTGATLEGIATTHTVDALFRKSHSPQHLAPHATTLDGWLNFPWEHDGGRPTDGIVRILQHIGEDPTRDGLRDTPERYVRAMRELTSGYNLNPAEILSTTFDVAFDEMVVVRDLPFSSLCEHHLLPFHGRATVAYIPRPEGRVVGLSKLARLVDCYARRLQVQERMTNEIAEAIQRHLDPVGVGVLVSASHTCMSMRGIAKPGEMVTSRLMGALKGKPEARAEFMALANP